MGISSREAKELRENDPAAGRENRRICPLVNSDFFLPISFKMGRPTIKVVTAPIQKTTITDTVVVKLLVDNHQIKPSRNMFPIIFAATCQPNFCRAINL